MQSSADVLGTDQATTERAKVLVPFGLTERQARFLATVMLHSGVFVGRQYAAFAGIIYGQKVHDFIEKLRIRGFVTPNRTRRCRIGPACRQPERRFAARAPPRSGGTGSQKETVRSSWRGTAASAPSARTPSALRRNGKVAHAEGRPGADATDRQTGEREAGDSHPAALVLFTPGDAWRAGTSHSGTGRTPGLGHDAALHAPQPGGARYSDSVIGDGHRNKPCRRGEIVEAAGKQG
jgi:hypothetical protein